jgi:hypothetical protein
MGRFLKMLGLAAAAVGPTYVATTLRSVLPGPTPSPSPILGGAAESSHSPVIRAPSSESDQGRPPIVRQLHDMSLGNRLTSLRASIPEQPSKSTAADHRIAERLPQVATLNAMGYADGPCCA